MIEVRDLYKTFGERTILRGMSFNVPRGTTYVIMGRSGIGKSVTLKHVIGIIKPDQGTVVVDGLEVPALGRKELSNLRKRMGYLFQNGALINWLTVADNVALPLREHTDMRRLEIRERVMDVLKMVGMDHASEMFPARISGGMKLRAGLARSLVLEPEIVLYDEPNAGLDPIISDQIHNLIVEVRDRLGVTGLVVTHSKACATTVGNTIGVVEDGAVLAEGSVDEMLHSEHPLVRQFLGGGAD